MLRAKFRCDSVERNGTGEDATEVVTLTAVTSGGDNDPNKEWSKWTPWGELTMGVTNPSAHGKLEQGKEYYLDLTLAE